MRLLYVANTPADPNMGASGIDLETIAALRRMGSQVDEVWAPDIKQWIRHWNTFHLLELPYRFAEVIRARCRKANYEVIQVNQPHAYQAARQHQTLHRPGVFVNRSHGWESHAREARAKWGGAIDRRPAWRRLATAVIDRLLVRHNNLVVRYSDGVILSSVGDRDYVLRHNRCDPDRLLALSPGISERYLQAPPSAEPARFRRLLHVGQFVPHKAPTTVAAVANEVLETHPDATLTWVCAAAHHTDAAALLRPSVRGRVTFLGWMPRSQLMRVYDDHGLFLFPSLFEGFSLAFLEAMARGLCVLTSRINGTKETIVHGNNGFVFSPVDVAGFVREAQFLLRDLEGCLRISRNARQTALAYTWDRTATEAMAFYERLLKRKHAEKK